MKKLLSLLPLLTLLPALALAQSYPSPTYRNVLVSASNASTQVNDTSGTNGAHRVFQSSGVTQWDLHSSGSTALNLDRFVSGSFTDTPFSVANATGTATFNDPLVLNSTLSGVTNPGAASYTGNCAPSGSPNYCFYQLAIGATATHDAGSISGASSFVNGLQIAHYYGGSTMTGGRQSLYVQSSFTGASSASNQNHNYVAGTFFIQADAGDGGTGLTNTTAKGAFFAMNPYTHAYAGATNLLEVTGAEYDIAVEAGASTWYKNGLSIAQVSPDATQGAVYDAAIAISNGSTGLSGWKNGILFGPMNGAFPMATNACMMCSSGAGTVTTGIDFSSLTITGNFLNSNGFTVNGAGTVASNGLNSTGTIAENGSNASVQVNDTSGTNGAQTIYQKNGTTLYTTGSASSTNAYNVTRYVSGTATDNPISIANATGVVSMPDGIAGTTTGATASVGNIGNVQSGSSSAVSLTAGTVANATSVAVAAGDYMVQCQAQFNPAGTTAYNNLQVGVNTVSTTLPAGPMTSIEQWQPTNVTGVVQAFGSPFTHVSLASAGTLYCPVYANFSTSTMTVTATITALRIH